MLQIEKRKTGTGLSDDSLLLRKKAQLRNPRYTANH
jgi:hypothetical protein